MTVSTRTHCSEWKQAARPSQSDHQPATTQRIGLVIIGRNEGQRLRRCLESAARCTLPMVYVDSGSVDLSVLVARELRIDVVELDASLPFTAARARNAGCEWLLTRHPDLDYVQFVDGDCELCDGWLESAGKMLDVRPDAAIVCGRIHERHPEASIYNRICEMEWRQEPGEVDGCGGNMMVRLDAFRAAGGFDPLVIAAEDTELCVRLRLAGWKIVGLAGDMVRHDAAMLRFGQWWRRMVRAGHAMTEGAFRHRQSGPTLFGRAARRIALFGLALPMTTAAVAWPTGGWSWVLMAVYPLQFGRTFMRLRQRGEHRAIAALYAAHCVLAKFPQAYGQLVYVSNRLRGRRARLIEHKTVDFSAACEGQAIGDRIPEV